MIGIGATSTTSASWNALQVSFIILFLSSLLVCRCAAQSGEESAINGHREVFPGFSSFPEESSSPWTEMPHLLPTGITPNKRQIGVEPPHCDRGEQSHRYDPLACWLWKLKVQVPDQRIKKGVFSLSIKDMVCSSFTIASIKSDYVASGKNNNHEKKEDGNKEDPSIDLSVSGISAVCLGEYKSTGMSGTVRAIVENNDSEPLKLDMTFVSGYYQNRIRMAESVKTSSCDAELKVPEHDGLRFSGSMSAKFIDLFSKPIAKYVSSALATQLCPIIQSNLDPTLTKLIQEADDYMKSILPKNETTSKASPLSPSVIDHRFLPASNIVSQATMSPMLDFFRDTPLLYAGLEIANDILSRYLDKGIIVDILEQLGGGNDRSVGLEKAVCSDCGYFFRGFNGLVKSLTNGTGEVHFAVPKALHNLSNITFVVPKYGKASVVLKSIHVSGLDTLKDVDLFRPTGNQSFVASTGSATGFNVSAAVDVTVVSIPGGIFQGDPLRESFHVHVNSSAVTLLGDIWLGIDRDQFENITVGQVISAVRDAVAEGNYTQLQCLLAPLKTANFSRLVASLNLLGISFIPDTRQIDYNGDSGIESMGQLEVDIDGMLNNFLRLFLGEYSLLVTETLAGIVDGPAMEFANTQIAKLLDRKDGCAAESSPSYSNAPDFLDFRKLKFLKSMNQFLNGTEALRATNRYIRCVEGYVNQQLPTSYTLDLGGAIIDLKHVHLENFGTLDTLELLDPEIDGYHLHNGLSLAQCSAHDDETCSMPRMSLAVDLLYPELNISGKTSVVASFGDFSFFSGGNVQFDVNKFRPLTLSQLLSRSQCFGVPTFLLNFYGVSGSLGALDVDVNASLTVGSIEPVQVNFQTGRNESLAGIVSTIISWSLDSIQDLFNTMSKLVLPKTSDLCEGTAVTPTAIPVDPNLDKSNAMLRWNIFFLCVALGVAQVSIVLVHRWQTSDEDTANEISIHQLSEPLLPAEPDDPGEGPSENDTTEDPDTKDFGPALMCREGIPGFARHALPILTIGTIVLLLSSNLSVGASVNATVTIPGSKTIALPSLFAFSLGNTVREFYDAGIYALLFLVLVFSGIWPYLKLVLMMFAWAAPSRLVSQERREHLLLSLDSLSKFSLVDAYVLVLMLVAFRFHLDLKETAAIDVFVTPGYGFYGFLLATSASLVIGEAMLYYHRSVASRSSNSNSKESLRQHYFEDKESGQLLRMSNLFQILLIALAAATLVLLGVGVTKESFHFEFGGLAGILLGDERIRSYSMMSLGSAIPQSVEDPSSIGITFIQAAYFFYAIVMPFTCTLMVVLVFCYPMTATIQQSFVAFAEIANAWSAIEVFVISIVAALFEISTFAEFIIGDKCDIINDILAKHFDEEMGGDDTCYSVETSVGSNAWYLFVGVIFNSFLVSTLLRFAHCAIHERLWRESEHGLLNIMPEPRGGTLVDIILRWNLGRIVFVSVEPRAVGAQAQPDDAGASDEDVSEEAISNSLLWEDWRQICSWT